MRKRNFRKARKVFRIAVIVLTVLVVGGAAAYMLWEQAPDIAESKPAPAETAAVVQEMTVSEEASPAPTPEATPAPTENPLEKAIAPENIRQDGVYTVLLVGEDKWTGNTDTILVGKIDTVNHKMDFVSIPRDTLINMDWDVRKINSVVYKARNAGQDPAEQIKLRIKELIGFDVDCYAIVSLEAFIDTIDALGGVEYDVPQEIYFEDYTMVDGEWEDSYNYIYPGKQTLSGFQCMGLVRYRHGYEEGDIGRIKVQHDFLKSCARQFISLGNIPNVGKVIDIISESVDTDLSAANIAFFLRQALMCKSEDINFHIMPHSPRMLGEPAHSYAVCLVYQWRDMINEVLNPYSEAITINHLNVMFNDYIGIGCTSPEVRGAWYYVSAAEEDMAKLYGAQG